MNSSGSQSKFTKFLRNNAALLIIVFCAVAILTVVLATTLGTNEPPLINDDPTAGQPSEQQKPATQVVKVYFASPLEYSAVGMQYTTDDEEDMFVFSSTLNKYLTHRALDLIAADGTEVVAMYDGTVTAVAETYGYGNTVTIDHGDGVVATYASLSEVEVVQGQNVKKGEKLGAVGSTASYEFADGAHLHLEVTEKGVVADPTPYIKGEIFREVEMPAEQ